MAALQNNEAPKATLLPHRGSMSKDQLAATLVTLRTLTTLRTLEVGIHA